MNFLKIRVCLRVWCGALLFLLGGSASWSASEWPEFRGQTGQGIATAIDVPLSWNESSNVAWKVEIPGGGWSSPVLSRGKLYLTTAMEEAGGISLNAVCAEASSGRIIWNTGVFRPDANITKAMHKKNTLASPTPIIRGDRLFVHFGHMGTAALDLDGRVVWRQTELKYPPTHGNGGSPVVVDDLLVFSCDAESDPFLVALDVRSGTVRWKTPRDTPAKKKFSFSTPLLIEVEGRAQIVSAGSGFLGAYEPKTGLELWRVRYGEGYSVVPRPVFAHGLLFIGSGFDAPSVYAVKPTGASGDATETNVAWSARKGAPNTPSLVVVGDELYFVSDSGIATCADARTGTVHWSERLGGDFSASPVYADGRIYFQNETGTGYVIAPGKEFKLLARNEINERTLASYAVADRTIFIRSERHLWRIGSGKTK
ncbi:MAG: serine/threonine protein kinase [Pedosphaera sp.]|nr:serine/threonine protein kinase [Pedosphaera sp.]